MCVCALSASLPGSGGVFVFAHTPFLTFRTLRNATADFASAVHIYMNQLSKITQTDCYDRLMFIIAQIKRKAGWGEKVKIQSQFLHLFY